MATYIYVQDIIQENDIIHITLYNGTALLTADIPFEIATINSIKCDGTIVMILDINNVLWEYHYVNNSFVPVNIIRGFYLKQAKTIKINPLSNELWSVQRLFYKKTRYYCVETIFCKETYDNTIKIYDPWINPDKNFNISYPSDISPIVIDSSHRTLIILTSNNKIYYKKVNFDLAGYNPFIKYTFNGKIIRNPIFHFQEIEINNKDFFWQSIDVPYNTYNVAVIDDIIYAYNGKNYFTFMDKWEIYNEANWNHKFVRMKNIPVKISFMITINDKLYSEPFYDETNGEYVIKTFSRLTDFLRCKYKYIKIKK